VKKLIGKFFDGKQFVRGNVHRNDKAGVLSRSWGYVYSNFLPGDYLEFGVYKGDSLIESFRNYRVFRSWIDGQLKSPEAWRVKSAQSFIDHVSCFRGLDTFAGMPDNQEAHPDFIKGNFLAAEEDVRARCESHGLGSPQLTLYKGLFSDTKDRLSSDMTGRKAAIIHFDCDLYGSTRDALEVSKPWMQIGTILLFDDYNAFNADQSKGQRRAFREFCADNAQQFEPWQSYYYLGQAFLRVG